MVNTTKEIKTIIESKERIRDIEWHHLAILAIVFTVAYQIALLWMWVTYPDWDWILLRISLSLADAVGIFAVVISIWIFKKGKAEWESEEGRSMKWITTKFGTRLKKAVDEGEIKEQEIDEAIDGLVNLIIKTKEQSKGMEKVKEAIEYAQRHKGHIDNAIEFLKTIPKLSPERKTKIMEIWGRTDIDKVLNGLERGLNYLSDIKEVTKDDIDNVEKQIKEAGIDPSVREKEWIESLED